MSAPYVFTYRSDEALLCASMRATSPAQIEVFGADVTTWREASR
jgi:hypothetical protein